MAVDTSQIVITADGTITFPVLNQNFAVIKAILDQLVALGGDTVAVAFVGPEAPIEPNQGAIWLDNSAEPNVLKVYFGEEWIVGSSGGSGGGAQVFVQAEQPDTDAEGSLWFDTDEEGSEGDGGGNGGGSFTGPDAPPSIANAMDDEFNGDALDAKWLPLRMETADTFLKYSTLSFGLKNPDDNKAHAILQPLPDENWEFATKLIMPPVVFNYFHGGIIIANSANGLSHTLGLTCLVDGPPRLLVTSNKFDAGGSYMGQFIGDVPIIGGTDMYLNLKRVGANITLGVSRDGCNYQPLTTIGAADYIGAVPNRIGLAVWRNGAPEDRKLRAQFDWFRRLS